MSSIITPALASVAIRAGVSLARLAYKPDELDKALRECSADALELALQNQLESSDGLLTAILRELDKPGECLILFANDDDIDVTLTERVSLWEHRFVVYLDQLELIDKQQVDTFKLAQDFSTQLRSNILSDAKKPNSNLINYVLLASSVPLTGEISNKHTTKIDSNQISNLSNQPTSMMFYERTELTKNIEDYTSRTNLPVVIYGASGCGKSALAHRLARGSSANFIWWIRCNKDYTLTEDCVSLVIALGQQPECDPRKQLRHLISLHRDWILILDDVRDPNIIPLLIPSGELSGTVYITGLHHHGYPRAQCFQVPALNNHEGAQFLSAFLYNSHDELYQISDHLGGLPLALQQAGSYIRDTGICAKDFIQLIKDSPIHILTRNPPVDHPETAVSTHYTVLNAAISRADYASGVLDAISLCETSGIPRAILSAAVPGDENGAQLDIALSELIRGGLIQVDEHGAITCHAITSSIALNELGQDRIRELSSSIIIMIHKVIELDQPDAGLTVEKLIPIAEILMTNAKREPDMDIATHSSLALFAATNSRSNTAIDQLNLAESLANRMQGDLSQTTVEDLIFTRGIVVAWSGRSTEAIEIFEDFVERNSTLSTPARLVAAFSLMASCQEQVGNIDSAIELIDQAIAASESSSIDLLPQKIYLLSRRSSPAEAAESFSKLSAEYTDTDSSMKSWMKIMNGRSLLQSSRPAEAVELFNSALELDLASTGANSLSVGRDLNDLGMAFLEMGNLEKAEQTLNQSLKIYMETESITHVHGGMPALHLGRVYLQQIHTSASGGDYSTLLQKTEDILILARTLNSVASLNNSDLSSTFMALADLRIFQNRTVEAARFQLDALKIDRMIFGDDHIESAIDASKLSESLIQLGNFKGAEKWMVFAGTVLDQNEEHHPAATCGLWISRLAIAITRGDSRSGELAIDRIRVLASKYSLAQQNAKIGEQMWTNFVH